MNTRKLEFDDEWSPRKWDMVQRDILVFLRQMGAKNPRWIQSEQAPEPPKLYLHLQCVKCGVDWYADVFQPCPKCGMKEGVDKAEAARVPLPPPADAPAAPAA